MRPASKFLLATWLLAGAAWAAPAPGPAVPDDPAPPAKPAVAPVGGGTWSHAFAAYGEPKYPRGFRAFDYVNRDAPKGGVLYIQNPDRRTTYDKYNPFTIKGQSPAGLTTLMFEPLAIRSGDEPATMYGALAEEMLVAPDRSSITFRIHPTARFYNGDPVLAQDVKHSYDMMTSKYAAPGVRTALDVISRVTVLDFLTIRFDL
jgi:peptide/nickel transport system substrate-binding protein/microcin C transport system substrate-binding protein